MLLDWIEVWIGTGLLVAVALFLGILLLDWVTGIVSYWADKDEERKP